MEQKITARVDSDALRYMLIELHGRLERWTDPGEFEGESLHTRLQDPEEIEIYERLARAFNQLAAAYTEQREDLPVMMIDKGGVMRYWPEDPRVFGKP